MESKKKKKKMNISKEETGSQTLKTSFRDTSEES